MSAHRNRNTKPNHTERRKTEMLKSQELREKRAALAAEAQSLLSNPANGEKFDRMMADVDAMAGTIERQERLEKLEVEMRSTTRPPLGQPGVDPAASFTAAPETEERKAAHKAAFRSYIKGDLSKAEIRTYSPMSDSVQGAFLVPQGFQYELEQALKAYGGMRPVSRSLTTTTGNALPWPTSNDTGTSGEQIGENTTVSSANPNIQNITLNAWKYSTKMVQVSVELLQDSAFDLDAYIREIFVTRIGRITNNHFTVGGGTTLPNGVVTASAFNTNNPTATVAGAVNYDDLVNLEHSVDPAYRPGAKFMLHDSTLKTIKKLKDAQGHPLWVAGVGSGAPDTILGYSYQINQDMPVIGTGLKQMLFGAFNKYLIRTVKDLYVLRLDERFAELGQVAFIGFARYDGNLIDAGTHPIGALIGA
jgi:HK97 family phage major capsid protein